MHRNPSHWEPTGSSDLLPTAAASPAPGRIDPIDEVIGLGYFPDELLPSPVPLRLWPDDDGRPGRR